MRSWNAATLGEHPKAGIVSEATDPVMDATLHYLGYHGQPLTPELADRTSKMIAHCEEIARPKEITRTVEPGTLKLPGADIARHLSGAVDVVLMAVTLGHDVDRELRRLSLTDPLGQVLFDAAATALVERHADKLEARIRAQARARDLYCSWRFSPGYGDLPLDVQQNILGRLDAARRLGITLTADNLMVPTKSVTAIVGLHRTPQGGLASSCDICSLRPYCSLRTQGITCRG